MGKQFTKQTISVGIAGTGFIGPAHLEALRRNNIKVIGLAEATRELAAQKAAELGIPKSYASFEDLLSDPDIDVVHLATPNYLHHGQAKAALLAGKHVVCEKPLAMNTAESAELVRWQLRSDWLTRSILICAFTRFLTRRERWCRMASWVIYLSCKAPIHRIGCSCLPTGTGG